MGDRGMVFRAWVHKWEPLNSQWLVLGINGADFLHCWVANSIWLEYAELLITKLIAFVGGLFRAFTNFRVVLCVKLITHSFVVYSLLLLGLMTHYCES